MVFSNFTRTESGNQIFFKNSTPIEYVEKLKYYKDDSSGSFTKKEFRWSFNNTYWSNWENLNQGNVSDTEIKNNRYLFIEVRYTKSNPSANVTFFEVHYNPLTESERTSCVPDSSDSTITPTQTTPQYGGTPICEPYIIDVTNAQQLCGKGCDYYLWRPNHKGQQTISTIVDLQQVLDDLAAPIDGGVWITDIQPSGSGNVGDQIYSSDGNVLDSCLTDTTNLIVSVLALPGHTNYKPVVTINSNPVSLSESSDKPLWTGTYNMTYNFADASITAVHENGARWSTIVDADSPATILSADFTGGYPGTQTELKVGDTYAVRVQTDVAISSVIVDDYGAATGGTYSPPSPTNDFTFIITIADRGNTTVARGLRLRVVKPTGSTSANYLTENQGSVDGKDLVNLNNTYPEISFTSIDYPVGQQAIKSSESAIVNHTVTDYNTINYTSPGGQLNITNSTIYEPAKNVDYSSGGYNINTDNFSISANRAANNAASSYSTVVWIANTPATLSVSHASKMRSGGNDGTSVQNHQIAINSDQRLLSAPDLIKDTGGTWAGTGFSWSPTATTFTRNLAVHDDESKTTYNWGSITGTNLAGIVTSTNSGTTQYVFSGFVVRTITVQPLLAGKANTINVEVTDYTKLSSSGSGQTLTWTVKDLTIRSGLGDTADGQAETWSASGTGSNPTTIYILDTNALNSSSQASTFTIQEGV